MRWMNYLILVLVATTAVVSWRLLSLRVNQTTAELGFSTELTTIARLSRPLLKDRKRLLEIRARLLAGKGITPEEKAWLRTLSREVGLPFEQADGITLDRLLRRVDVVPPSLLLLALQQACNGSLQPKTDVTLRHCPGDSSTLLAETIRTLNSGDAYWRFRGRRQALRRRHEPLLGSQLLDTLNNYFGVDELRLRHLARNFREQADRLDRDIGNRYWMVEPGGIEPPTSTLPVLRSPS